jgi:hypothetical protein
MPIAQIISPIMTRAMTPSIIHPKISITIIVLIIFPLNKVLGKRKIPKLFKSCCKEKETKKFKKSEQRIKKMIAR